MSNQGYQTVRYFTQADITAGLANNLPGTLIEVIDVNGQPTGVSYEGQPGAPTALITSATSLGLATTGTPAMNGPAALGTGTTASHADHVHPTDTNRAASVHTHAETDVTNLPTDLSAKQPTLVSGTNIKTINGQSALGAGDLPIAASSMQTAVISATGGTKTTSGLYTIHTFTAGGSFVPNGPINVDYLVVAGGGGGGSAIAGGGGAGGLLAGNTTLNGTTAVTVGAGGAGGVGNAINGANGSNSVLGSITAIGGGGGGATTNAGGNGGSGGGSRSATNGTGTAGQGNNGGNIGTGVIGTAGGGGGASAVGANAAGSASGAGGNGTASSITGVAVTYAGGGGGGGYVQGGTTAGAGGSGGGGAGGVGAAGINGAANLGGGGGGGGYDNVVPTNYSGGNGGSGVVILRYLTSAIVLTTPVYANNAAAIAGGLTVGSVYRSNADPDVLSVVH